MNDWIKQNLSWIIGVTVATAIAWGSLNARVGVIAQEHSRLDEKLNALQELTERLIVLEESQKNVREDLREIKSDIKDIKTHFEIRP